MTVNSAVGFAQHITVSCRNVRPHVYLPRLLLSTRQRGGRKNDTGRHVLHSNPSCCCSPSEVVSHLSVRILVGTGTKGAHFLTLHKQARGDKAWFSRTRRVPPQKERTSSASCEARDKVVLAPAIDISAEYRVPDPVPVPILAPEMDSGAQMHEIPSCSLPGRPLPVSVVLQGGSSPFSSVSNRIGQVSGNYLVCTWSGGIFCGGG